MDVFITGGTGLIGSAVVAELIGAGHSVSGLARSDRSVAALESLGATPVRGSLTDLDVLRGAASAADGVITLAFDHEMADDDALHRSIIAEGRAARAMAEELAGSGRPLATVSGTPWVAGRSSTEQDSLSTDGPVGLRNAQVTELLGMAEEGVRVCAVRMPRTVHRDGEGGFAGILTGIARQSGISGYPDDGTQRWPAVHALDAASLFRLVLEQAPPGTAWHAVADEGDQVRDIAAVIGRRLNLPVRPVPATAFGPLGPVFEIDQPATSTYTREQLGWEPTHPSLLEDLELLQP